jgi:hypothetical protein
MTTRSEDLPLCAASIAHPNRGFRELLPLKPNLGSPTDTRRPTNPFIDPPGSRPRACHDSTIRLSGLAGRSRTLRRVGFLLHILQDLMLAR